MESGNSITGNSLKTLLESFYETYNTLCGFDMILVKSNDWGDEVPIEYEKFDKLATLLESIYNQSLVENCYWFDCPFKVYKNHFEQRCSEFLKRHIDATKKDFIDSEISSYIETDYFGSLNKIRYEKMILCYDFLEGTLTSDTTDQCLSTMYYAGLLYKQLKSSVDYSREKKIDFLKSELKKITDETDNSMNPQLNLIWKGNQVELVELIKALIESGRLQGAKSEDEVFKRFSQFLQFDINKDTGIKDIRKRCTSDGRVTKFLDILSDSLELWNKRLDTKT